MLWEELNPEEQKVLADAISRGRLGRPEDIAAACAFLAFPAAAFVNGQVLGLDGGRLLYNAHIRYPPGSCHPNCFYPCAEPLPRGIWP